MANARFIFSNEWDKASLSLQSGTAAPQMPLQNTQRYNNSRTFRSQTTAEVQIQFEFTDAETVSGLVLWRHNLTADALIRLELFDAPACGGNRVFDSGLVAALDRKTLGDLSWGLEPLGATTFTEWELAYSVLWFGLTAARSGRLTIQDPANPDGYLELCRVYLGPAFEPQINVDLGHALKWENATETLRTAGGSLHTLETAAYRELRFSLAHLQPTERGEFFEETRRVSTHRDFFISLRPDTGGTNERDYAFAAKFSAITTLTSQPGRYSADCSLREV